jgi:hypothetical protein
VHPVDLSTKGLFLRLLPPAARTRIDVDRRGALFYVFYNHTADTFGRPIGLVMFAFNFLVLLSVFLSIVLLNSIDSNAVQALWAGAVPEKLPAALYNPSDWARIFLQRDSCGRSQ